MAPVDVRFHLNRLPPPIYDLAVDDQNIALWSIVNAMMCVYCYAHKTVQVIFQHHGVNYVLSFIYG